MGCARAVPRARSHRLVRVGITVIVATVGWMSVAVASEDEARRQAFQRAYTERTWGTDQAGKGTSGYGSTPEFTKLYRVFLQDFLAVHRIKSVVDAGCGLWEFSRMIDWTGIDYLGLDIVGEVIAKDQQRFGRPNIRFRVADIVRDPLPPADLLIVKDVLQHLSNAEIARFLTQLPRYRHVLIVNSVEADSLTAEPRDIRSGDYRTLDVTRPPFSVAGTKVLAWRYDNDSKLVVHLQPRVTAPAKPRPVEKAQQQDKKP